MAPRVERKLAAILAADVVGYSRLMEADEAGTHARLKALRQDLVEPRIADHAGRIVKLTGDGALVEFASVVEAVLAAVEIQRATAEHQAELPEAERIRFRIGINLGDVIFDDDDIYGEGVNVAARLEGLAEPGGICVSRTVHNHVRNKLDLAFAPMGEHKVKNIAEPISVFRVLPGQGATAKTRSAAIAQALRRHRPAVTAAAVLLVLVVGAAAGAWYALWRPSATPPATVAEIAGGGAAQARPALPLPDKPSIAVLPFANLSGEPRQERLAGGLTEDIITDLSRFRELFVIARNSTEIYKGKPVDVRQIARELGVQYVMEGSLQADGDRVRITAQLIDAASGNHVWSERYDRPLDDVFAIQDEVTQTIASQLGGFHGVVARSRRESARRKPPANLEAFDLYVLGLEEKHQFTREGVKGAQQFFRRALELDPNYARAYYGLAQTHGMEADFGWRPWQEAMDAWRNTISKAIALDPYDSGARSELAFYYQRLGDMDNALSQLDEAVKLNPNDADVLATAGLILPKVGQPQRALELVERAVRLNPHYPDWYHSPLRDAYFHTRRFEDTIAVLKTRAHRAPVIDPLFLALSYAQLGRESEVKTSVDRLFEDQPDWSAEKHLSGPGNYARDTELDLFLESVEKAGLPVCATLEQLAKYPDMKRLEQCEAQRASG
jgi:TolB-like protein/class 3 adenylate cyclase/tetratricopeptide (TPR) repeat protein